MTESDHLPLDASWRLLWSFKVFVSEVQVSGNQRFVVASLWQRLEPRSIGRCDSSHFHLQGFKDIRYGPVIVSLST